MSRPAYTFKIGQHATMREDGLAERPGYGGGGRPQRTLPLHPSRHKRGRVPNSAARPSGDAIRILSVGVLPPRYKGQGEICVSDATWQGFIYQRSHSEEHFSEGPV